MDCSMPGFPVHHELLELTQTQSIELVMPSNHLILCCPLLLLPSNIVVSSDSVSFIVFFFDFTWEVISTQMVSTIIYKLMRQRVLFLFLIWTHIYNCLKESLLACPKDSFNAPCSNRIHYHLQTCSSSRFLLTITSTRIYSGAQATYLDIMLNSLSLNSIGYLLIKCFFFIFYYYYFLVFGVLCFLLFIFNWSIIALQCYVGFCHTSV